MVDTMPDHIHLLVSCDPLYGIHRLVNQIKGRSSRRPGDEFPPPTAPPADPVDPHLRRRHGRGATQEVVKRYVENQRNA
jgi:putative transposase